MDLFLHKRAPVALSEVREHLTKKNSQSVPGFIPYIPVLFCAKPDPKQP